MAFARLPDELAQAAINAYAEAGWNKAKAARDLGLPWKTYRDRLETARVRGLKPRISVSAGVAPEVVVSQSASVDFGGRIRVLAIPDAHNSPKLPVDRFKWIGAHVREGGFDAVVDIGDSEDMESLCSHVGNDTLSGRLKPSVERDLAQMRKAKDAFHNEAGKASVQPIYRKCQGNHEKRIWRFEDQAPEIVGLISGEYNDTLRDYGWVEAAYGEPISLGGVDFVHCVLNRMGRPMGGENTANNVARRSVRDTVVGHGHNAQVRTEAKAGLDERVRVFEIGTALPWGYVEDYAGHNMTGWWWGVAEFEIYNGRVEGWNYVPMFELERRYG